MSSSPASLQKVATCSDDASCRLVDLETGQLERELLGHCSEVKTVAWHASLALLLTGSKDYTVKLWGDTAMPLRSLLLLARVTLRKRNNPDAPCTAPASPEVWLL